MNNNCTITVGVVEFPSTTVAAAPKTNYNYKTMKRYVMSLLLLTTPYRIERDDVERRKRLVEIVFQY